MQPLIRVSVHCSVAFFVVMLIALAFPYYVDNLTI